MGTTLRLIVFLLLTALAERALAQPHLLATEYYHQGELALLQNDFKKALRRFRMAADLQPDLVAAQRGMGFCYEIMKDYRSALSHYLKVVELAPKFSRAIYYQIGDMYFKLGLHSKALAFFDMFRRLQMLDELSFTVNGEKERLLEDQFLSKLSGNLRACQISMDTAQLRQEVALFNLGPGINTRADEYFPFLSNDQSLIYFTRRRPEADENLLIARSNGGAWQSPGPVGNILNSPLNEGMSTLVRDGRRMYFTACNREGILGPCDIWEAELERDEVKKVSPIRGNPNSTQWESQAAISCDGSTLYFSSNRPGGQGGADIWLSKRQNDGSWSEPQNLGPQINTPQDEEAPFISNDENALYFSSTGHLGMGDQDLFVSFRNAEKKWGEPVNLGPKINTPHRELGFFLSADGKTGYFASDRPNGFGGMDIYRVELSEKLSSEPITFSEFLIRDSIENTPVKASATLGDGRLVESDGQGRFFLCLHANDTLAIHIQAKGFHTYTRKLPIPEWDNKQFFTTPLLLQPIRTPPPPPSPEPELKGDSAAFSGGFKSLQRYQLTLYFQFDSDELELGEDDKLLQFVGQIAGKELMRIELNGFADEIGEDSYNLSLSVERARRIALLLIDKGFPVNRISMKGNGELRDGSEKSKNRKVEIKVTTLE